MQHTFDNKHLNLFCASTASTVTQTASIDLRGFGSCCISLQSNGTDAPTTLKVEESDDNSTWAAANMTGGTHFTIAASSASTEALAVFDVNAVGRKRYLKLSVTPASTQTLCAMALLGRAADAGARNAANVVNPNA